MFAYTRLYIEKLLENTQIHFNLIIVDNGSTDKTQEFFSEFKHPKVHLIYIRNNKNLGPIYAYNQGIKRGSSEYVCIMHNDVLIFEKGWLEKILNIMDRDREIGIAGLAGRKRINKKGLVDESSLVHNLQDNEDLTSPMHKDVEDVAVLDGLCFIIRRAILEKMGGLDESYGYMHCYDLDTSLASLKWGYKNVVVNIEAMHLGGATRKTKRYKEFVPDDYKLLNINYKKFRNKWKNSLPISIP